jgi:hypothetical protein
MRPKVTTGFIGLLVLAACGGQGTATDQPSADPSVMSAQPSAAASAAPSVASALEGVWHTELVTPDDMAAVLQVAGLQEYTQPFLAAEEPGESNVFTLRVSAGRWVFYWSRDGGLQLEQDSGAYTIDGDTVTIRHDDQGSDTHRWSVDGDTLTLTYVSDTFPSTQGIPEEVYQRVLYMSSPWARGAP